MKPASRKHIRFVAAPQGSDHWLSLRKNGIGGSEIGGVLGQADYTDPIKVYLEKIGEAPPFKGNRFTFFGKYLEDPIAELYSYWPMNSADATCEQMLENYETGAKQRNVRRVNGYIVNDKYPWLYSSLDRTVWGDPRGRGILETKNTTSMEKDRYTHGFNKSFYCQVQQYLLIDEADFADVAIYYDGNNFDVKQVLPDPDVQQLIIEQSLKFWERVLKARVIKEEANIVSYYGRHMDFVPTEQQAAVYQLMQLEPELTGTENEYKFLMALVNPTEEYTEKPGTDSQLALVRQYVGHGVSEKEAKAKKTAIKEQLVLSLGGYHRAAWGEKEYISYQPTAKGNRFRVSKGLLPEGVDE